jgi:serine/threonine-protein kinase
MSSGDDPSARGDSSTLPKPTQVGNFTILSRLDRGGMGEVYIGYHRLFRRHVAVKLALEDPEDPEDPEYLRDRLLLEAVSLGAVSHPNVVTVHELGYTSQGRPYLVLELLGGQRLDRIMDSRGRLAMADVLPVVRQAALGLSAFHAAGIVCADVKPDNIMVVGGPLVGLARDCYPWIKLFDLGAARAVRDPRRLSEDTGDPLLGTTWYMSPEAVLGLALDERADIYSLGVLLFELITGTVPFRHRSDSAAMSMHLWAEPASVSAARRVLPYSKLDLLVRSCLAKSPAERPRRMHDLIALLDEAWAEWEEWEEWDDLPSDDRPDTRAIEV